MSLPFFTQRRRKSLSGEHVLSADARAVRGEQRPSCGPQKKPRWQQQQIFPLGFAMPHTPVLASGLTREEELLCKSPPSGPQNWCLHGWVDHSALHTEIIAFFCKTPCWFASEGTGVRVSVLSLGAWALAHLHRHLGCMENQRQNWVV